MRTAGHWALLALLSLGGTALLRAAGLPAAGLLGPMVAAIVLAVSGVRLVLPPVLAFGGQSLVGVLMASHLSLSLLPEIAAAWPLLLAGTAATLAVSSLLGWLLARSGALPGTTAIWGSSPGAAAAMTLLSEAHGADVRLVAVMQYLRVLCCALSAAWVLHVFHLQLPAAPPQAALPATTLAASLAVAGLALLAGWRLAVPGGALLLPLLLGPLCEALTGWRLALPAPLWAAGAAAVGWSIGSRFDLPALQQAARLLPRLLASVLALVLANAGVAWWMARHAGVDPLTAFLATSPGGADSVALIAASAERQDLDLPFVMAMQVLRFGVVVLVGPWVARALSRPAAA